MITISFEKTFATRLNERIHQRKNKDTYRGLKNPYRDGGKQTSTLFRLGRRQSPLPDLNQILTTISRDLTKSLTTDVPGDFLNRFSDILFIRCEYQSPYLENGVGSKEETVSWTPRDMNSCHPYQVQFP